MSTETVSINTWGVRLVYFSCCGLVLAGAISFAQYVTKVGEVQVVVLIPIVLAFILAYACGLVQRRVERGMRLKRLKPTHGKGRASRYWLKSYATEVMAKTVIITAGAFTGLYFLLSAALLAAPPLVSFVVSIDLAGVLVLVLPAYLEDKAVVRKR
ncbi:MAG: hypothetical protein JW839_21775 [Candidatus Lokiarchaeota archaeon]|nr:hypothetical protein [Candidatus Lokiarchaeota archaeon]